MFLICRCHLLRLVVPELLLGLALDLRNDELDVLGNQLALLPGDRLTGLITRPDLLAVRICLPESDTVLLGHIPTLGHLAFKVVRERQK